MVHSQHNHTDMRYVSTRGAAPEAGFDEVLLAGLAPDGGLYVPRAWPSFRGLDGYQGDYKRAAVEIMSLYLGQSAVHYDLPQLVGDAYAGFDHPDTAPLRQIGPDLYLLELFHGPTLAFKDFAMQVLSRLMERALKTTGGRTTIIGATSGDTGAAAVEAFRGRQDIELFILFPNGRISDVQRKQMTTAKEDNVHAIAIDGTFDDAQAIVKLLLGDPELRARHRLSAINSINWARIVAQIVYYYTAAAKLGPKSRPVFSVPTGNFGDIFAAFAAAKMGLPIDRLIIASNENDILPRALTHGRYEPRAVFATDSPSMDIQISSNFERLLFEESNRDAVFVSLCMARLSEEGGFDLPPEILATISELFAAHRIGREEAGDAMQRLFEETGLLIDPHTAVGLAAAKREQQKVSGPIVVLATAHPAKFPEAVKRATGRTPEIPERLERFLSGRERFELLPNSASAVASYIGTHTAPAKASHH